MDASNHKLCYVENGIMYFTEDFEDVKGDDWNDSPYEDNAGEPYEELVTVLIAFKFDYKTREPADRGSFSVNEINKGAVPWLYNDNCGGLYGGDDLDKCIDWLQKAGYKWGELHD